MGDGVERAGRTHSNHLHEIAIIHLVVQYFLAVGSAHASGGWGYDIQGSPQRLHDFTIDPGCPRYEVRSIVKVTAVLMPMNMPKADARGDDHV